VVGLASNDMLTHTLIDFLMGETDGVPKDPNFIFKLYMALGNFTQVRARELVVCPVMGMAIECEGKGEGRGGKGEGRGGEGKLHFATTCTSCAVWTCFSHETSLTCVGC
jgi:hypothetical protein